ncbi:carbohydrate ABC transporter permease [Paenibacillus sp. GCM10027628]|uniref:carbohydrate ABC transporter permease n=1 Tax=Paenibacillus sp. GCM10027628 TaxID=3273413 RepID=UPI00362782C7
MEKRTYSWQLLIIELIMIAAALLFLAPFYFVVVNSLKTFAEVLKNSASLPQSLHWSNYMRSWEFLHFPNALKNTLIVTVLSDLGLVLIASMAAYKLVRTPNALNRTLFSLFLAAMVIPFQAIMIPLMKVAGWLNILNSLGGLVLCYLGLGVSFSVFLYHGFVKSIPAEIEEAAVVDGCTPYGIFWKIVFPLLMPMTVTIVISNSLWFWNDFLLPMLMMQDKQLQTLQVAMNALFGQYTKQWDLALAALVMAIMPILVFFLLLQRYIVEGISAGAVKG